MIGYGPEKENFALELTYNYGIDGYDFGNDLQVREEALCRVAHLHRVQCCGRALIGWPGWCLGWKGP